MNKKFIITKNTEIQFIIKKGKKLISKYFIIYFIENNIDYNRYCISVSKKIGNAVIRNKQKRTVKEIIRKNNIKDSKNYVIILRKEILNINYQEKERELINLIKGENK